MSLKYSLLIFVVLFEGCSVGPPYEPPCVEVPGSWKNNNDCKIKGIEADENGEFKYYDYWWQIFEDEKLDELEMIALENNRDLFIAYERIKEYSGLMGIAAANFYPQLTLNPAYSNIGELIKIYASSSSQIINQTVKTVFRAHELLYYLPLNLSYQVDLWGQIQDQYDNAKYNWRATQADYDVVMLTITSNLATAYYQVRVADKQLDLLDKIIVTRRKSLEINTDRYESQITFYADVALAAEELELAITQKEEIARQRKVLENQIAVLLGYPASEFCLGHMPIVGFPPCIPEGLPSEVLMRRPDVAEAEYLTRAAHALVKEAVSEFYPSLSLTSIGGFESPIFRDFMQWISRYWMYGFQANQIVFDGFRTPSNLKVQCARFKEAGGQYQKVILNAFQEVEDALTDTNSYVRQYETTLATAKWAIKANQLYKDRFINGLINYIEVVNTERDALNFQLDVNTLQGYRFVSTIQLIRALGGGWSTTSFGDVEENL